MKRFISITLALILAISLCACTNNKPVEDDLPTVTPDIDVIPDEIYFATEIQTDDFIFVMDCCDYADGILNLHALYTNLTAEAHTVYIDNVSNNATDEGVSIDDDYTYVVEPGSTELVFPYPIDEKPESVFFTLSVIGSSGTIYCIDEWSMFITIPMLMENLNEAINN